MNLKCLKIREVRYLMMALCALFLTACIREDDPVDPESLTTGYVPVYGNTDARIIRLDDPRPVANPGKIYLYEQYLLVNEIKKGIHVFDNTNPLAPQPVSFIHMLGNTDMAIKNNILYADHMGNVVAIEFMDFNEITTKGTLPLKNWNLGLPPPNGFYFQCVEPEKGLVIDWKKFDLKNMECYAIR